jgi:hypothetical protein
MPFGALLLLAVLVLPLLGSGDADVGHGTAGLGVARLGIVPEAADDLNLVQHGFLVLNEPGLAPKDCRP